MGGGGRLVQPETVPTQVGLERDVELGDLARRLTEPFGRDAHLVLPVLDESRDLLLEAVVPDHPGVRRVVVGLEADTHLVEDGEIPKQSEERDHVATVSGPRSGLGLDRPEAVQHHQLTPVGRDQPVRLHERELEGTTDDDLLGGHRETSGIHPHDAPRLPDVVDRDGRETRPDQGVRLLTVVETERDVAEARVVALEELGVGVDITGDGHLIELGRHGRLLILLRLETPHHLN